VEKQLRIVTRRVGLAALALGALALPPISQPARLIDADLAVSLAGSADAVVVGQSLTYTVTVVDKGPDRSTDVKVNVTLSGPEASISAASSPVVGSQCTIATGSRNARCLLGTIAVGASAAMTITVQTAGRGTLTTIAKTAEKEYDPIVADTRAEAKTSVRETGAPVVQPVYGSAFDRRFLPRRAFSVRWTASDTGSGVASYDIRYRAAPATGGFGPYVSWLTATSERSARFVGRSGTTYCFSVRATDRDGNASDWADERCTSLLLPAVAFGREPGWIASGSQGGLRTHTSGASLTLDRILARRLVLSALVSPGYGRLQVSWNGHPIRTLDLGTRGRPAKQFFTLGDFGTALRGRLVLTVVSDGKTVAIYAVGIAKV
jgi:hypothetical protein